MWHEFIEKVFNQLEASQLSTCPRFLGRKGGVGNLRQGPVHKDGKYAYGKNEGAFERGLRPIQSFFMSKTPVGRLALTEASRGKAVVVKVMDVVDRVQIAEMEPESGKATALHVCKQNRQLMVEGERRDPTEMLHQAEPRATHFHWRVATFGS
jgi:hypothetical protein